MLQDRFYAFAIFLLVDKTSPIQDFFVMIKWNRILGRSKLGRSKLGRNGERRGVVRPAQLLAALPLRDAAYPLRVLLPHRCGLEVNKRTRNRNCLYRRLRSFFVQKSKGARFYE